MKKLLKIVFGVIGLFLLLGFCSALLSDSEDTNTIANDTEEVATEEVEAEETTDPDEKEVVEEEAEETAAEEVEEVEEEPKEEEPQMTMEQKNAIKQAENYISMMAFSKSGLVKQLEFEGYSTEDATFAVENITVDWREQAVKHAKTYTETMAFSRQGLIDQLVFEGHSQEDADYAATEVGY